LARQLHYFMSATAEELNRLADGATERLQTHYSAHSGASQYGKVIEECWA